MWIPHSALDVAQQSGEVVSVSTGWLLLGNHVQVFGRFVSSGGNMSKQPVCQPTTLLAKEDSVGLLKLVPPESQHAKHRKKKK